MSWRNFLRGAGSILNLFPPRRKIPKCRTSYDTGKADWEKLLSDAKNIQGDWEKVIGPQEVSRDKDGEP